MIGASKLWLRYAGRNEPTLRNIDLAVGPGELVLVSGPTGCGKSSLLGCLNGILQHETSAEVEGEVRVAGHDVRQLPLAELCRLVGTVFQNPDSQICTATPETEVAFGLENQGLDRATMRHRIDMALQAVGLEPCRHQPAATLSGGQKQRLAIACALALQPKVLLLDEPISQLDPQSAQDILEVIARLKATHQLAVVLVEHRIEETIALADRVVLLHQGEKVLDMPRDQVLANLQPLRELGLNLPLLPELFERLGRSERPLRPEEAPRLAFSEVAARPATDAREPIGRVSGLRFAYTKHSPPAIDRLDLTFYRRERVALMGANGSGKSTLLHLLAGLLRPQCGTVRWQPDVRRPVGLVMQMPDLMVFCDSVRRELAFAPQHAGWPPERQQQVVAEVLVQMNLQALADEPPFALSRGQRLRTAVGSVLSMQPNVLLLDEPTTGQDREQIERIMGSLEEQFELVVFCTHDVQTTARHATRVIVLHHGRLLAEGTPTDVLFDDQVLQRAGLRRTSLQQYAMEHGVRALDVDGLLEMVHR